MATIYPLRAVRALALESQRLTAPNGSEPPPNPGSVLETVNVLGALQIDTLHVVARSHYLVVWSRHGAYDPRIVDRLAYHPAERQLFEGWQHALPFSTTVRRQRCGTSSTSMTSGLELDLPARRKPISSIS